MKKTILVLALCAPAFGACVADTADPGCVHFLRRVGSDFDVYTNNMSAWSGWLNSHFWRMQVYSTYFDNKLTDYPRAWAYIDSYGLKPDAAVVQQHPDWIMQNQYHNWLYLDWGCSNGSCPQWAADITVPEYRAWFIDQCRQLLAKGYKGLWIDDVNLVMRYYFNGQNSDSGSSTVQPWDRANNKLIDLPTYRHAFAEFMTQVHDTLKAEYPDREILHNAIWSAGSGNPGDDADVQQEMRAADWVNKESGVASDGGITGDDGYWSIQSFFRYVDQLHAQGSRISIEEFQLGTPYGVAAYFLVNNGTDAFGDTNGTPDNWPAIYDIELGAASGARYTPAGTPLIRRDFAGGVVVLNPKGQSPQSFTLPSTMTDLEGNAVSSATLNGGEAGIYVKQQ